MKRIIILVAAILLLFLLPFPARAEEDYLSGLDGAIPGGVREALPENYTDAGALDAGYLLSSLKNELKNNGARFSGRLSVILALVILCAVFSLLKNTMKNESVARAFDLCGGVCLALCVGGSLSSAVGAAGAFIDSINTFVTALLPTMTALFCAGGNAASAAAANTGTALFVAFSSNFCRGLAFPIIRICFSLALVSVFSSATNTAGLAKLIKSVYTVGMSLLMALLGAALAYQTALAQSVDSLGVRLIKFASGSFVPVVGGALGDAAKTVVGSLSFIKSTVGAVAVAVIIIMLLPTLVYLFADYVAAGIGSAAAGMLGCPRESAFLAEIRSVYGFLIGTTAALSVFFIFGVTVFVRTAFAIGG